MTIFELGALGEFVGAIAVVGTFIYLAIQIRQNTKAMRAQIHEHLFSGYIQIVGVIAGNSEAFSKGLVALGESAEKFSDLSEAEKTIYMGATFGFFKHYEHMYVLYQEGLLSEHTWSAWSEHIRMYYHQPGVLNWWRMRRTVFIPAFREFLETSEKPNMTSMADLLESGTG